MLSFPDRDRLVSVDLQALLVHLVAMDYLDLKDLPEAGVSKEKSVLGVHLGTRERRESQDWQEHVVSKEKKDNRYVEQTNHRVLAAFWKDLSLQILLVCSCWFCLKDVLSIIVLALMILSQDPIKKKFSKK